MHYKTKMHSALWWVQFLRSLLLTRGTEMYSYLKHKYVDENLTTQDVRWMG